MLRVPDRRLAQLKDDTIEIDDDQGVAGPLMDSKARQRVEDTVFFFNQEMLAAREGGGGKTETLYPDPKPVKPWWRKFI